VYCCSDSAFMHARFNLFVFFCLFSNKSVVCVDVLFFHQILASLKIFRCGINDDECVVFLDLFDLLDTPVILNFILQLFVKTWFFSYICEVKKYIVVFYFDYIF